MSDPVDTDQIEAAAKALLDDRVEHVRALARMQQQVTDAEQRLAQVRKEHAKAWRAAQKAGWSEAELRKAGLKAPHSKPAGRPRKDRSQTAEPSDR